ncbi:hypothetical protein JTE90_017813 [Oedothorax gibbosus]|uniref:Uncharacterized protein n=1 Tax=Oedothorax gibbosus TaxID=931172 RepID=A0AAV6U6M2_9ARAC|nr:hypothetical protein JTE90_017813 [Oedothorax gibbosus]
MLTPKCALCSGPHTANFRLCPKRPLTASQRDQRPEQVTPSAAQQPHQLHSQPSKSHIHHLPPNRPSHHPPQSTLLLPH